MDFYAEVFRAVFGYLSDKLNIPLSELNKAGIADQLKIRAVGGAQIEEVLYIITTAEKARFSPTPQSADEMFYRRTVAVIEKLEEAIG